MKHYQRTIPFFLLPVFLFLIAQIISGTVHAQDKNAKQDFWFLKKDMEPTRENRLDAIQNVGRALLDFAVYQPTDADGKPLVTFPEAYRQKLIDAGFVFDFVTDEQLSIIPISPVELPSSSVGRSRILVIPKEISLSDEIIQQMKYRVDYAFLDKAPEITEPIAFRQRYKSPDEPILWFSKSFADWKKELEAERQKYSPGPGPLFVSDPRNIQNCYVMDQIGDNLDEAVSMFSGWARTFPEDFVAKTGVKLLARRGLMTYETKDEDAIDVFYILANTKENAKPVDGWFQMKELSVGREVGHVQRRDGGGGFIVAKNDLTVLMEPATGKIGKAAVRNHRSTYSNIMEIRIKMQPGDTLVVRIVRERWEATFKRIGFQEFESLPDWEYDNSPKLNSSNQLPARGKPRR